MIAALFLLALAPAPAPPLQFDHRPLGSVARVLSARFHARITIRANGSAPITGDFSGLDLPHALAAAGRQAGLVVLTGNPGFILGLPEAQKPTPAPPSPPALTRQMLLRERARLLEEAAKLGSP